MRAVYILVYIEEVAAASVALVAKPERSGVAAASAEASWPVVAYALNVEANDEVDTKPVRSASVVVA